MHNLRFDLLFLILFMNILYTNILIKNSVEGVFRAGSIVGTTRSHGFTSHATEDALSVSPSHLRNDRPPLRIELTIRKAHYLFSHYAY